MDKQIGVINITDRLVVPVVHKTSVQTKSKRNKKNLPDDYQEKLERQAVKELNMEIEAEAKRVKREAKRAEREAKRIALEKEQHRFNNIVVTNDEEIDLSLQYKLLCGVY
ncbi:MAG: hypothetical protein J6A59_15100, partial [Lachnospiraceae bacterium]|nr:hypothetical protein [Lachnospiraceae bacterium]